MITLEEIEKLFSIISVKFNDNLKEKKISIMKTVDSNGFSDYIQHFEKKCLIQMFFKKNQASITMIDIKMSAIRIF